VEAGERDDERPHHKILKEIGKRGGEQARRRDTGYYTAIGRVGALKRWGKKKPEANGR